MDPVNRTNIHDAVMIFRFSDDPEVWTLRNYCWESIAFRVGEAERDFGRAYGVEDRAVWTRVAEG